MKTPAPRTVGDLLPSALPQIVDRLVELRIRAQWASIVGPDVARRTRPESLTGGTLRVVVDNSPWLHELTLRASNLTAEVRSRFGEVRALRFVLGAIARETAAGPTRPPRPVALTATDRAEIEAAAEAIADSDVAAAARRLLTTARRFPRALPRPRGVV